MNPCIICNQIHSEQICTNCGFDCKPRVFVSEKQLMEWNRKIVLPYRKKWNDQNAIVQLQQAVQELQTQLGQTKEEVKQLREMVETLRKKPILSQTVQASKTIPKTQSIKETITDSWEEIFHHIKVGDYKKRYSIGDTKAFYLKDVNHTCILMQIAGFDKEIPVKSGIPTISWISVQCLPYKQPMGWKKDHEIDPPLRAYLNGALRDSIPEKIRRQIKSIKKAYFRPLDQTWLWFYDTIWIPGAHDIYDADGKYRPLFSDPATRQKHRIGSVEEYETWYLISEKERNQYHCVLPDGTLGEASADTELGIAFGFCT